MKPLRILALLALCAASACAHAVGRLADLQVQDRATGRTLPVYWHDGRPYVVGTPGAEYRVVIRNRHGEDLLAVVSVDGVNVLSGEDASAAQGGYVIDAWRRVAVDGWRKSLGEVAAFYFTALADSYAGRTGRPDNVGVIGVALFQRASPRRSWLQDMAPEAREESSANLSAKRAAPAAAAAPLGTGHGPREDSPARYVVFERATTQPVETITLYYDSRPNLVAQGVIPVAPCARAPDPFPGHFVADPS